MYPFTTTLKVPVPLFIINIIKLTNPPSVGVTTLDRPAAAPQTGPFDLGYRLVGHPDFASGITAASTIFVSSSGTGAFLPVISEMRHPRDYHKAVHACMSFVTAAYLALALSLVMYRYCGRWVASPPSLGSAGPRC